MEDLLLFIVNSKTKEDSEGEVQLVKKLRQVKGEVTVGLGSVCSHFRSKIGNFFFFKWNSKIQLKKPCCMWEDFPRFLSHIFWSFYTYYPFNGPSTHLAFQQGILFCLLPSSHSWPRLTLSIIKGSEHWIERTHFRIEARNSPCSLVLILEMFKRSSPLSSDLGNVLFNSGFVLQTSILVTRFVFMIVVLVRGI